MESNNADELIIGYHEALCAANLAFFRTTLGAIYQRLVEHQSTLQLWVDDNQTLQVATTNLPATPAFTFRWWLKPIYDGFKELPNRRQFLATARVPRLNEDGTYTDPVAPTYFHSPIDPKFRERFAHAHAAHYPANHVWSAHPLLGTDSLPIVVVMGASSGWHLNRLTEDYRIRHLILVEPDLDMMLLSMYLIDWRELVQTVRANGRFLSIVLEPDPYLAGFQVALELKDKWPVFFASGLSFITASHDTNATNEIERSMRESFMIFLQGWGFFDDEILSLKHASENIRNNWPTLQKTGILDGKVPAIIVGAGPSLDGLIDTLREIRDHVIIICCGTAITALEKAGIKPDFLIEVERLSCTPELLKVNATPAFTRSIPIIFPVSMHPDLAHLTDTPLMVGKLADTGTRLYSTPGKFGLTINTNPTVTNCGIDVAAMMGAQEIYLFGVDLGYVDQGRHHASESAYHNDDAGTDLQVKMKADSDKLAETCYPVPGNFRDTVLTHEILDNARREMAYCIRHRYQNTRVYNCNDGALVEGAEALQPDNIDVSRIKAGPLKHDSVQQIVSCFAPPNLADEVPNRLDRLQRDLEELCVQLTAALDRPIGKREDLWDLIGDVYMLIDPIKESMASASLVHGSVMHMLCACYDSVAKDPADETALKFARTALDEIKAFLVEARKVVKTEVMNKHASKHRSEVTS